MLYPHRAEEGAVGAERLEEAGSDGARPGGNANSVWVLYPRVVAFPKANHRKQWGETEGSGELANSWSFIQ